jgi:predicted nucleic acid-binding protein
MKIYLDTSTLFKLYHQEIGTEEIDDFFATTAIIKIYISEIAKIEFISTVWKKIRMAEILEADGLEIIALFKEDLKKYDVIPIDVSILELAEVLFSKYGRGGLRTLDSIQLASAISIKDQIQLFKSADKLLTDFFKTEIS